MRPTQRTAELRNGGKYNSEISFSNHRSIIYDEIVWAPASSHAWTWILCSIWSQQNLFCSETQFELFFLSFVIKSLDYGNQTYLCPCSVYLDLIFVFYCLHQHDFTLQGKPLLSCPLKKKTLSEIIILQQGNEFSMNVKKLVSHASKLLCGKNKLCHHYLSQHDYYPRKQLFAQEDKKLQMTLLFGSGTPWGQTDLNEHQPAWYFRRQYQMTFIPQDSSKALPGKPCLAVSINPKWLCHDAYQP